MPGNEYRYIKLFSVSIHLLCPSHCHVLYSPCIVFSPSSDCLPLFLFPTIPLQNLSFPTHPISISPHTPVYLHHLLIHLSAHHLLRMVGIGTALVAKNQELWKLGRGIEKSFFHRPYLAVWYAVLPFLSLDWWAAAAAWCFIPSSEDCSEPGNGWPSSDLEKGASNWGVMFSPAGTAKGPRAFLPGQGNSS